MGYQVEFKDGTVDVVETADGYAQEGTLTTFFRGRDGRCVLDSWAKRLASYRTADITRVRLIGEAGDLVQRFPPATMVLKVS